MKKQILLTNYYTMTTIKVTSESFYSITEDCLKRFTSKYLQPIITQYFIDNKSEIWLLFLIAHSKR